jgi:hypothetical protein
MSGLLIIPSARLIPAELQGDFGQIPSCMIPFGGAPALQKILNKALNVGMRVVVAAHENRVWIEEFLSHSPKGIVQAVDVGQTKSLGETIHHVLKSLDCVQGPLIVNFGDTLVHGELPTGNAFYYACPDENFRWTTFILTPSGFLEQIIDKGVEKGDVIDNKVFVGVFSFDDANRFSICLESALSDSSMVLDPFYTAVMNYFNSAPAPPIATHIDLWIDLGHLDTYYDSRRIHAMGQRSFNAVSVDAFRGILTKRSKNETKFCDEIQWYSRIPEKLSYLAPRVFHYSIEPGRMSIDLEFYGYPPLSDIFLFSRLDLAEWRAIFLRLSMVIKDMGQYYTSESDRPRLSKSLHAMYLEKTMRRVREMMKLDLDPALVDGPLLVNGKPCITLRQFIKFLPEWLKTEGILDAHQFSVIHGDFCLSNILFDRRNRTVRLVDPRGRFGDFDIFGDPRYDLAKLSHCFNGGYDFLVHGLFSLESPEPGVYYLAEFMNNRHCLVRESFNKIFLNDIGTYRQIRIIESLLFLSMVPLHADRPLSQKAFLIRGLETATRFMQNVQ